MSRVLWIEVATAKAKCAVDCERYGQGRGVLWIENATADVEVCCGLRMIQLASSSAGEGGRYGQSFVLVARIAFFI